MLAHVRRVSSPGLRKTSKNRNSVDQCLHSFQFFKNSVDHYGRYNIYLNTKGTKGDISLDLEVLFEYIDGGTSAIGKKTNNELVNLIDSYIVEFNRSDTWRKGYMTLELLMQDNYKSGLAKGLAKGLAEGEKRGEKKGPGSS